MKKIKQKDGHPPILRFGTEEEERLLEIIFDNDDEFRVIEDVITETYRWDIAHSIILLHVESGKYYQTWYRIGATEQQDYGPDVGRDFIEVVKNPVASFEYGVRKKDATDFLDEVVEVMRECYI